MTFNTQIHIGLIFHFLKAQKSIIKQERNFTSITFT